MFSIRLGWMPAGMDEAGPEGGLGVDGCDCGCGRSPDLISDGESALGALYVLRGPEGGAGSAG
jgi:hypothetical protein